MVSGANNCRVTDALAVKIFANSILKGVNKLAEIADLRVLIRKRWGFLGTQSGRGMGHWQDQV